MTLSLSAQQASFFTNNGYLELEDLFSAANCAEYSAALQATLIERSVTSQGASPFIRGRDLWRDTPVLKSLLFSRKLSSLAHSASGKTILRLACDQWFEPGYFLEKPQKLQDFFCIQGIACGLFIQLDPGMAIVPSKTSPLGILPFPQKQGSALLLKPSLLINWPLLTPGMGLYFVGYALAASVYVQNTRDAAGIILRQYDYGYGDPLRNDTHPLLIR